MYTVVGGNPFIGYTGTTTYTGLRVVGTTEDFDEMEKIVKENYDECAGLMLVLYNGRELEYDNDGKPIIPS